MSEVKNSDPANETATPQFNLKAIYLRNTSFETGSSPILLRSGIQPEVKLELRVQINPLENQDEVVLDLIITARDNSNLLYLIKIQQAACFVLTGFASEQKTFILNTTCPNIIYPYAGHMANTLSVQGGFPLLNLMPIDFVHMYAQQQKTAQAEATHVSDNAEAQKPTSPYTLKSESRAVQQSNKWADLAVSAD